MRSISLLPAILAAVALVGSLLGSSMRATAQERLFRRVDANADGAVNLSDPVAILAYLFQGGDAPSCLQAADSDDDGAVNLTDAVVALSFLFQGGARPPAPFNGCGEDRTPDTLGCESYAPCTEFSLVVGRYSTLRTIAGRGFSRTNDVNVWEPRFEGGPAIEAELSRPHHAMRDDAGNLYIADRNAHAIRKVDGDGIITTVAGTNRPGDGDDAPGPGTERDLRIPNGLYTLGDGTVYILDLGNSKVRRLAPDGVLSTLFAVEGGISTGRGLWVSDDESLAYVASGNVVKKWTPDEGVTDLADGFVSLGSLAVSPDGDLVVTDRGGDRVFRVGDDGSTTPIAGAGPGGSAGIGTSAPALEVELDGVRAIAFVDTGGYLLGTHEGSQLWYVDTGGFVHLFLEGRNDHTHAGDGEHFRTPGPKISEVRAIALDSRGNVLITENDFGYVREIARR